MLAYRSKCGSNEPGLSDALASRYVRQSKQTYRKVSLLYSRWVRVDFRTVQYVRTFESVLLTTLLRRCREFSFVLGSVKHGGLFVVSADRFSGFTSCPRKRKIKSWCCWGKKFIIHLCSTVRIVVFVFEMAYDLFRTKSKQSSNLYRARKKCFMTTVLNTYLLLITLSCSID